MFRSALGAVVSKGSGLLQALDERINDADPADDAAWTDEEARAARAADDDDDLVKLTDFSAAPEDGRPSSPVGVETRDAYWRPSGDLVRWC